MADAGGAERLGVRLLGEVEECGLGELLASLRTLIIPSEHNKVFNIPELDALLPAPQPAPPIQIQHQRPSDDNDDDDDTWDPHHEAPRNEPPRVTSTAKKAGIHVLELVSPPHGHHPSPSGKTSLLHLLITTAILPPTLSTTPLSGLASTVILFDPLHHFSLPFLATTLLAHIISRFTAAGKDVTTETARTDISTCVTHALHHVHVFRPASWASLLATLRTLQTYLFDAAQHASTHRPVHALILDDVDAFLPALRTAPSHTGAAKAVSTASAQLTHVLSTLSSLLSCAVVTTSRSTTAGATRPGIPLSWPAHMQLTRLAVRRVEVLKFAPGLSVQEAEGERAQRGEVVARGRFEAWRVGGGRDGEGFVFRVGQGVAVEKDGK